MLKTLWRFAAEKMGFSNSFDTAYWMTNLSPSLTSMPLNMLAIPGSHNSCSYTISCWNDISPDEPGLFLIKKLGSFISVAPKVVVRRWATTQNLSCTQQLEVGIRYFDMRLAPHPKTQTLHFVHGLYGIEIQDALTEMSKFLQSHPKEIVLIHFQHFYEFTLKMHKRLINDITRIFRKSLCPLYSNLNNLTLNYLWKKHFQVIIVYKCNTALEFFDGSAQLWPNYVISYPWPNKDNASEVIKYLEARYNEDRPSDKFYVVQGILTPSKKLIALHFLSSLQNSICEVNSALSSFIRDKNPKMLNIIMSDFVDEAMSIDIINLNFKYYR